ncbi:MAG: hypothetical protein GY841_19400, partial [FCB group bacterium]|nr:hypothetical protein [FCB group bacterium]
QSGRTVELEGASKTADVVDSTSKPPYFEKTATLETRARKLLAPFGLQAKFEDASGGPFPDGMTIGPTEKVGAHLLKYARQRGMLVSNTNRGDVLFWKAKTTGFPVASIEENADFTFSHSATEYGARYNSRKLYNSYRVVKDTPSTHDSLAFLRKNQVVIPNAVTTDDNVPKSRSLTIKADETTSGDIQNYAEHVRSAIYAEALTMTIPMPGWTVPFTGDTWEVNTLISVTSETLMIPDGFTFIIRAVEFLLDNGSQSTNLSIVPPQVYSGEPVPYVWSVKGGGLPSIRGLL